MEEFLEMMVQDLCWMSVSTGTTVAKVATRGNASRTRWRKERR